MKGIDFETLREKDGGPHQILYVQNARKKVNIIKGYKVVHLNSELSNQHPGPQLSVLK